MASARDHFADLVAGPEVPLGLGCLTIAAHLGHPLAVEDGVQVLDDLAAETHEALTARPGPADLGGIVDHLVGPGRFSGDRATYYDVANSLLPSVLARRRGIPITLAVVVVEVARRLEVDAVVVGMPGHVLVGDAPAPSRWLDPFTGPGWLDARGVQTRFAALHGPDVAFDPSFLHATPPAHTLGRVLNNAAGALGRVGDPRGVLRALELRASIPTVGTGARAQVELADAYVAVGRVDDAVEVLGVVRSQVDPRRRGVLDERIGRLRSQLN